MVKTKPLAKNTRKPLPQNGSNRYVCIHGHFYQPPRENPWLETVEVQDSAAPYHDWNDRITAECYAPNGASRIVNFQNEIIRIVNNYGRMSFNFGPTLLSWLHDKAPRTYRMILDADKVSRQRYSGHGSAIAQVYNHIIMPLASERDARTQIRWGIADFEHRFHRKPEGMWLAETAVNRSVLDLLAQEGIKFTILAPAQCARVRKIPASSKSSAATDAPASPSSIPESSTDQPWAETPNASVDPTHPYTVPLDEGRSIAVFFYDGPGSRAIAFEGLLNSGEDFARRLLQGLNSTDTPQLSHVATDGESYGHHHKHGEMALSYAMHWIEEGKHEESDRQKTPQAHLTNYAQFLANFPPQWQAEVVEDTSWSCVHGVERWRSDCGCNGGHAGWNQEWRAPLREALDFLRDATAPLAEKKAEGMLKNLWDARDAYIHVILAREDPATATAAMQRFFDDHAAHDLTPAERITALELMELERHTQLMYTSCGWFFDEVSGIETVQIIAYAGRVLQLAAKLFGPPAASLEHQFLDILAQAKSNVPEMENGAEVYRRYVTGMRIGLEAVGAHYAISSIFRAYPEDGELFCFDLHRDSHQVFSSGRGQVALGRARIRSRITEEAENICFAVLHLGDQNLSAAVKRYNAADPDEVKAFATFSAEIDAAIRRANLPEVIRLIDRFFARPPAAPIIPTQQDTPTEAAAAHISLDPAQPPAPPVLPVEAAAAADSPTAYSLNSLFADEQHLILKTILNQTLSEMEESLRKIYEDHASLLHFLTESGMAAPPALAIASSFAINASLRHAIESDNFDPSEIDDLLARAEADHITLNTDVLGFTAGQRMKWAMVRLETAAAAHPPSTAPLTTALNIALSLRKMPFEVNLWQAQNIWNDILRRSEKDAWPNEWQQDFKKLGEALKISVDQLEIEEGVSSF